MDESQGCIETRVYAPPYASVAATVSDNAYPRPPLLFVPLILDHGSFVFAECHKQRPRRLVLIITNREKQPRPASTVLLIASASFDLFRFVRRRDDTQSSMRLRLLSLRTSSREAAIYRVIFLPLLRVAGRGSGKFWVSGRSIRK